MEKKKIAKKKKVKPNGKSKAKKSDKYSVFDSKRHDDKKGSGEKLSREELIRRDKLKLAKRYEIMKLFDDSIKYYKQLGMDDEVARVSSKKNELYLSKAREFAKDGRYGEAAELYERLDMPDKAKEMRSKGGLKSPPPLVLDERQTGVSDDAFSSGQDLMPSSKSVRWEMPNVEMDSIGQKDSTVEVHPSTTPKAAEVQTGDQRSLEDSIVGDISHEIDWGQDDDSADNTSTTRPSGSGPERGDAGKNKTFNICPYCGEELNLPKQPKFCPYCREPFV